MALPQSLLGNDMEDCNAQCTPNISPKAGSSLPHPCQLKTFLGKGHIPQEERWERQGSEYYCPSNNLEDDGKEKEIVSFHWGGTHLWTRIPRPSSLQDPIEMNKIIPQPRYSQVWFLINSTEWRSSIFFSPIPLDLTKGKSHTSVVIPCPLCSSAWERENTTKKMYVVWLE